MAADPIFLDTSLIVAASVDSHPAHPAATSYLATLHGEQAPLCISPQVCREFMTTLTRKPIGGRAYSVPEALAALHEWRRACILLDENEAVVDQWQRLVREYDVRGKQAHDANIVAVMLTHGITRLGTRNPADFNRYVGRIQVEPVTP